MRAAFSLDAPSSRSSSYIFGFLMLLAMMFLSFD
jgi:hypothetical protein